MAQARSSDLLGHVRTLFGAGVASGLSDAELLERYRASSAAARGETWPLLRPLKRSWPGTVRWCWASAAVRSLTRATSRTRSRPRFSCSCVRQTRSGLRFQRVNVSAGALVPPPMRRNTNLPASFDSIFPASGGPCSWVKLSTSFT